MVRKVLLVCGIISSLFFTAMNVFIPMLYEGYSSTSRTPSELSAIDAPTGQIWGQLGIVYEILIFAFAWGVWMSAGRNRPLRVVGGLMLAYGVLGFLWPFAPMHQREVLAAGGATLSDTLHLVLSAMTVLLYLLALGFGATAFGKRFRIYSIATMVITLTFGALTGLDAPRIQANLPTPWVGVWERICIGVFLLWVVVLSIALLRELDRKGGSQT